MKYKYIIFTVVLMAISLSSKAIPFVTPSGHTLYFGISDYANQTASIVCPSNSYPVSGWDNYEKPKGSIIIPETIIYNDVTYTVTRIGERAFFDCDSIISVQIPSTVIRIDNWAFSGCTLMQTINIPIGVNGIGTGAFSYCSSLADTLTIPNGVSKINPYTFQQCFELPAVIIPNSVTEIGDYAFDMCYGILSIVIPNSVTTFGTDPFFSLNNVEYHGSSTIYAKTVNGYIEDGLVYLDASKSTLSGCSRSFSYVEIPSSVITIGDKAFRGCVYLDSVLIPTSVSSIMSGAFSKCCALKKIISKNPVAPTLDYSQYCTNCHPFYDVIDSVILVVPCEGIASYETTWNCFSYREWNANNTWDTITKCFNEIVPILPKWSVTTENSLMGNVLTLHEPSCDSISITVYANADEGFRFFRWSDGSTDNPRTIELDSDTSITCVFAIQVMDSIEIHDTTFLTVHDTTYINIHDTTYINIPVHDTTVVTDTVTLTEYVPIHDTTYINIPVHDTTVVTDTVMLTEYVPVHDTTYITLTDTVTNTVYDTVTNTVFDTIDNYIYDTLTVTVTDTLWLTLYDTITVHDTIIIHDTIVVGVDDVETVNAKIYTSNGQIVVEGAEGNDVWLYDVNGRVIQAIKQSDNQAIRFSIPASGTYLIKIGNYPARKVVVIR